MSQKPGLEEALTRRKGGKVVTPQHVTTENVLVTETYTPPVDERPILERRLRDLRAGEVGSVGSPKYPDVPYSADTFATILTRLRKGCDFMIDNLDSPQGQEQVGYFADLAESAHLMAIGYMSNHILNES